MFQMSPMVAGAGVQLGLASELYQSSQPMHPSLFHDGQIVAVNDFFVGAAAEDLGNFLRLQTFDPLDIGRRVVSQAASNDMTFGIAQSDDIAFLKFTLR